jgi:FAD/FMN-containing dehydrogenase
MARLLSLILLLLSHSVVWAEPFNTFDGPGFPACHNVAAVHSPNTINDTISFVRTAAHNGTPVRASGKGHMWYDTMCSDDPSTIIIRTEGLNRISDFLLPDGASEGSVMIEAGVTFFQLAEYLHLNNASMGYVSIYPNTANQTLIHGRHWSTGISRWLGALLWEPIEAVSRRTAWSLQVH